MQIRIHAKGFDLTPAMKDHVERKLTFALDRFSDEHVNLQVTLEDVNGPRGGNDKRCRIHVTGIAGANEVFEGTEGDLYVAIDTTAEKVSRWAARATKRSQPTHPDRARNETIRKPRTTEL